MKPLYKYVWIFWLSLVALQGCGSERGNTALGTIERDRISLVASAAEIIIAQPVEEGTFVKQGTLLVQLDERRQNARVAKAAAEKARAQAHWDALRNGARIEDIDAARAGVSGAEAALTVAEKNYQRALELRSKKLSTQAVLDQAIASRDSAQATLESARKQLQVLTNGTRKEDLDQAAAQYQSAVASWELENIQLQELSIKATRDGVLDSLPWNTGERVAAGASVAILLADEAAYARVYVPEPWRASLQVGAERPVAIDGVADSVTGRLRWIAAEPAFTPYYALNEKDRAHLMFLAEFDLIDAEDLPSGMPAEVLMREP